MEIDSEGQLMFRCFRVSHLFLREFPTHLVLSADTGILELEAYPLSVLHFFSVAESLREVLFSLINIWFINIIFMILYLNFSGFPKLFQQTNKKKFNFIGKIPLKVMQKVLRDSLDLFQ